MIMRIKKNDTVMVLLGKDRGKQGSVIEVFPEAGKVLIKGLGLVTRHVKPRAKGETGTIKKEEGYFKMAQVMPVCSSCKKPCRVNAKLEGGNKVRVCNKCDAII
jgi:large subunit ribosomal protein L24